MKYNLLTLSHENIAFSFLILFIVYNLQGSLYSNGSLISQSVLVCIIFIGCMYFIKSLLLPNRNYFHTIWSLFFIVNITVFLFTAKIGNPIQFQMLKNIFICSVGFFPFYYFGSKGSKFKKIFSHFLFLSIFMAILSFYQNKATILFDRLIEEEDNIVNNMAYTFVGLIPFLFFIKRNIYISFSVLLVIIFFTIQGAKRGAIIVGAVSSMIYLFYLIKNNSLPKRNKYVFLSLMIVTISCFSYYLFAENEYLQFRMIGLIDGDNSGRDFIYQKIFNYWYNSDNLVNLLFGFGFASSVVLSGGVYAHNDWLEVLSNFGLIGGAIYLLFFIILLRTILFSRLDFKSKMFLLSIGLAWFATSMFSMWYTSSNSFLHSILLGYFWGNRNYCLKQNINESTIFD